MQSFGSRAAVRIAVRLPLRVYLGQLTLWEYAHNVVSDSLWAQ